MYERSDCTIAVWVTVMLRVGCPGQIKEKKIRLGETVERNRARYL